MLFLVVVAGVVGDPYPTLLPLVLQEVAAAIDAIDDCLLAAVDCNKEEFAIALLLDGGESLDIDAHSILVELDEGEVGEMLGDLIGILVEFDKRFPEFGPVHQTMICWIYIL
jgi:hypothetical protein